MLNGNPEILSFRRDSSLRDLLIAMKQQIPFDFTQGWLSPLKRFGMTMRVGVRTVRLKKMQINSPPDPPISMLPRTRAPRESE